MKLLYSKDINLLNAPDGAILYPETNRSIFELVKYIKQNVNDNSVVVTLSETVVKQILRMVKQQKIKLQNMTVESNIPEYYEYEFDSYTFLESFSNTARFLSNGYETNL
jgi:5,10-methylene-tetrahydrofolate dehydrogenase/methenyl tetrahydrofolate cyclohydrolase